MQGTGVSVLHISPQVLVTKQHPTNKTGEEVVIRSNSPTLALFRVPRNSYRGGHGYLVHGELLCRGKAEN